MPRRARAIPVIPRGFTLVELLVVISVIALLISILLPSLKRARDQAKAVACAALQHGTGRGMSTYTSEYDEWFPGHNTTGMSIWVEDQYPGDGARMSQSHLPVQTFDWMTPLLRTQTQLPADRAKRFRVLLEDYGCPAVNFKAALYIDRTNDSEKTPKDHARFIEEVTRKGAYRGISYLMPVHFQYWGREGPGAEIVGMHPAAPLAYYARKNPNGWEVRVDRYKSKINRVGTPAEKIAAADGTRYLPPRLLLDFDHDSTPNYFGSFTTAGGWWEGSTAYGRLSPSGGKNIKLTYRHSGGIEAMFFDGHVEYLSERHSRKIDYWYPKGAEVVDSAEGSTDYDAYPNGYVIR